MLSRIVGRLGVLSAVSCLVAVSAVAPAWADDKSPSPSPSASSSASANPSSSASGSTGEVIESDGSALSRTAMMIAMASNNSSDNAKELDLSKLSQQDARAVGVFMSNYYTPFATEFGETAGSGEEEADKKTNKAKEDMTNVLKEQLGFSDTNSVAMTDYVWSRVQASLSEDSAKLRWYVSDSPDVVSAKDATKLDEKRFPATVFTMQAFSSGQFGADSYYLNAKTIDNKLAHHTGTYVPYAYYKERFESMPDNIGTLSPDEKKEWYEPVFGEGKTWAYLMAGDYPVYKVDLTGSQITPSVFSFTKALGGSNVKEGYGTSFFDFAQSEVESGAVTVDNADNAFEGSVLSQELRVSSFGDIVAIGANHQYVVMPGASNPYTFYPTGDKKIGSTYFVQNSVSFAASGRGALFSEGDGDKQCKAKLDETNSQMGETGLKYTLVRDSDMQDMNGGSWFNNEEGKVVDEVLTKYGKSIGVEHQKRSIANNKFLALPYFNGSKDFMWDSAEKNEGNRIQVYDNPVMDCNGSMVIADLAQSWDGKTDGSMFNPVNVLEGGSIVGRSGAESGEFSGAGSSKDSLFKNSFGDAPYSSLASASDLMSGTDAFALYLTYVMASENVTSEPASELTETQKSLGFTLSPYLPPVPDKPFELSEEAQAIQEDLAQDKMMDEIVSMFYYLISPDSWDFSNLVFSNKLSGFLISTHNAISGASEAPVVAGATKYTGFTSYVTMPELYEQKWTQQALAFYLKNFMWLVAFAGVVLVLYTALEKITLSKAIATLILFSLFAWSAPQLITGGITWANSQVNRMYSDKFEYWAGISLQGYSDKLDAHATGDDYEQYIRKQWAEYRQIDQSGIAHKGSGMASPVGGDPVVVKWQAPKKMQTLVMSTQGTDKEVQESGSQLIQQLVQGMNQTASGQSFTGHYDDPYLYRSVADVHNVSKHVYKGLVDGVQPVASSVDTSQWSSSLADSFSSRVADYDQYVADGFAPESGSITSAGKSSLRVDVPLSSRIVSDTFSSIEGMREVTDSLSLGVDTRAFNFGMPMFTKGNDMLEGIRTNAEARQQGTFNPTADGYSTEDYVGLAGFALMTESPFYYFAFNMYDQGMTFDSSGTYKDLVLREDGRGYFYNTKGNGEMRDFMDMRSFFTYTLPYLQEANKVVDAYDDIYGLKYYPGIPTVPGFEGDVGDDPVLQERYRQNITTANLLSLYSPYVDIMSETSYAQPTHVEVGGEKVMVANPLDANSYPEERPMVFSKSEQVAYGIPDNQLTAVEKKIQEVHSETADGMFKLLNSYNFNDSVVTTLASLESTYNFNRVFSETKFTGESKVLLPQGYEVKSFSYDAHLRLALEPTVETDIAGMSSSQFYTDIVQNSSWVTALMLVISDVIGVYIIPIVLFLIVVVFVLLTILKGITSVLGIEDLDYIKATFWSGMGLPALIILITYIARSWVLSLFLSDGNTAVTGFDGYHINLGSPMLTIVAFVIINGVFALVAARQLFVMGKSLWESTKNTFNGIVKGVQTIPLAVKALSNGEGFSGVKSAMGGGSASSAGASTSSTGGGVSGAVSGSSTPSADATARSAKGARGSVNLRLLGRKESSASSRRKTPNRARSLRERLPESSVQDNKPVSEPTPESKPDTKPESVSKPESKPEPTPDNYKASGEEAVRSYDKVSEQRIHSASSGSRSVLRNVLKSDSR